MSLAVYPACPPEWERLDPAPPLFAAASWLARMGNRIADEQRWFLHSGRPGEEVGFFGAVQPDGSASESKNPWRLVFEPCGVRTLTDRARAAQAAARAAAPPLESWFPSLVCTYPGLECFPLGPGRHRAGALDAAVAAMIASARAQGMRSVAFLYLQPEERPLAAALRRAGFVEFPNALRANLTVPGSRFADYLAMLPRDARKGVRRVRDRLAANGVRISRRPLGEATEAEVETLVRLRSLHRAKYGRRPDAAGERDQLQRLRTDFGERAVVYAAHAGDRTLAFCLYLDAGTVRHTWTNGADYTDPRSRDTYFELTFYAPIEDTYRLGGGELSFSYGAERVKVERGARLDEVTGYVLPLDAAHRESARSAAAALRGGLVPAAGPRTARGVRDRGAGTTVHSGNDEERACR